MERDLSALRLAYEGCNAGVEHMAHDTRALQARQQSRPCVRRLLCLLAVLCGGVCSWLLGVCSCVSS